MRCAKACASAGFSMGSLIPGTVGTSMRRGRLRPGGLGQEGAMGAARGAVKGGAATLPPQPETAVSRGKPVGHTLMVEILCGKAGIFPTRSGQVDRPFLSDGLWMARAFNGGRNLWGKGQ